MLDESTHNPLLLLYQSQPSIIPTSPSILKFVQKTTELTIDKMEIEQEEEEDDFYQIILSCIIFFGLLGNTISLVAIFQSRLRRMAANQYLIVVTITDSCFLAGLSVIFFKIDFKSYYACVVSEYILMVASYVSSWSISALTIERYLAIAHPLKHLQVLYFNIGILYL